jgi:hypothetical protein
MEIAELALPESAGRSFQHGPQQSFTNGSIRESISDPENPGNGTDRSVQGADLLRHWRPRFPSRVDSLYELTVLYHRDAVYKHELDPI